MMASLPTGTAKTTAATDLMGSHTIASLPTRTKMKATDLTEGTTTRQTLTGPNHPTVRSTSGRSTRMGLSLTETTDTPRVLTTTSRPMGATKRTKSPADTTATTRNPHTRLLVAATATRVLTNIRSPLTEGTTTQRTRTSPNHPTVRSMSHPTEGTTTRRTLTSPNHPTVATTRKSTSTSTSPLYTRPNLMWRGCRTGPHRIRMLHFMLTLPSAILLLNFIISA